ncbi:hypothetical protein [Cytobacillus stercorigallinarum]|uniref:hypothetical protein n=1 Tax=Cytobacillus stercorigallinarum TaxID=2762240 RepID=UPI001CD86E04|nr:hypothetical protein [Cytobacillus stercorigallinarum]
MIRGFDQSTDFELLIKKQVFKALALHAEEKTRMKAEQRVFVRYSGKKMKI